MLTGFVVGSVLGALLVLVVQVIVLTRILKRYYAPQRMLPIENLLASVRTRYGTVSPAEVRGIQRELAHAHRDDEESATWLNILMQKWYSELRPTPVRRAIADLLRFEFEMVRRSLLGRALSILHFKDYSLGSRPPVIHSIRFISANQIAKAGEKDDETLRAVRRSTVLTASTSESAVPASADPPSMGRNGSARSTTTTKSTSEAPWSSATRGGSSRSHAIPTSAWIDGVLVVDFSFAGNFNITAEVETIVGLVGIFSISVRAVRGQCVIKMPADTPGTYLFGFIGDPDVRLDISVLLGGHELSGVGFLVDRAVRSVIRERYTLPNLVEVHVDINSGVLETRGVLSGVTPNSASSALLSSSQTHTWQENVDFASGTRCTLCVNAIPRSGIICRYCSLICDRNCRSRSLLDVCPGTQGKLLDRLRLLGWRDNSYAALQSTPSPGLGSDDTTTREATLQPPQSRASSRPPILNSKASSSPSPSPSLSPSVIRTQNSLRNTVTVYDMIPGRLSVRVLRGTNLAAKDRSTNASDPYVIMSLGSEQRKTRKIRRELNPEWDETFEFDVRTSRTGIKCNLLRLDVYDWDAMSHDDYMGGVVIYLHDLCPSVKHQEAFELMPRRNEQVSGSVVLELLFIADQSRTAPSTTTNPVASFVADRSRRSHTSWLLDDDAANAVSPVGSGGGSGDDLLVIDDPDHAVPRDNLSSKLKREQAFENFVTSERSFVDSLENCREVYLNRLLAQDFCGEGTLVARLSTLFGNVISGCREFVTELSQVKRERTKHPLAQVGELFSNKTRMHDAFLAYSMTSPELVQQIEQLAAQNASLSTLLAHGRDDPRAHGLSAVTFFNEPAVHFLEYGIFFERLLELCEPTDPEYDRLAESLSLVNRTHTQILKNNERSRMNRLLSDIRHSLQTNASTDALLAINDPARRLLFEAHVTSARGDPCVFILLDNVVLIAKEDRHTSISARGVSRTLRPIGDPYPLEDLTLAPVSCNDESDSTRDHHPSLRRLNSANTSSPTKDKDKTTPAVRAVTFLATPAQAPPPSSHGRLSLFPSDTSTVPNSQGVTCRISRMDGSQPFVVTTDTEAQLRRIIRAVESAVDALQHAGQRLSRMPNLNNAISWLQSAVLMRDSAPNPEIFAKEEQIKALAAMIRLHETEVEEVMLASGSVEETHTSTNRVAALQSELNELQRRHDDLKAEVDVMRHTASSGASLLASGSRVQSVPVPLVTSSADQEQFQKSFELPPQILFIAAFSCAQRGSGYSTGLLFVTPEYVCYKAKSLLRRTLKVKFQRAAIQSVASVGTDTIQVVLAGGTIYVYTGFSSQLEWQNAKSVLSQRL